MPLRRHEHASFLRVSDGSRTRDRRYHNPSRAVPLRRDSAQRLSLSVAEFFSVALNLDPA